MLYGWIAVFALLGLVMPAMNAIMSKEVGPTEQGELQGAVTSVAGLTSIVAPVAMSYLFAYFTGSSAPIYFPGASFVAASLCLVLAAIVFAWVKPHRVSEPDVSPGTAEQQT